MIKDTIKHFMLPSVQLNCLQAASIVVESRTGPFTVSAVYCPPRFNISHQEFDNFFQSLGNRFLAGGDYNAKHLHWGSRLTTPRGRQLYNVMHANNYDCLSTGEPTYWPSDRNKVPDLLDFFVTKGFSQNNVRINSSLDLSSDHSPVIVQYSTSFSHIESCNAINHKLVDWEEFKYQVNCNIDLKIPLKTQEDVEQSVNHFNCVLQNAIRDSKKEIKRNLKTICYPNHIKEKIAHKRRLRRIWQNSRNPRDKNLLNNASQNLKRCLAEFKNECFRNFTSNLTSTKSTDYSLWKATKFLKRPKQHIPPLRNDDGSWAKSNLEKAETFSNYFSKVFKPFPPGQQGSDNDVFEYLDSPLQMTMPIPLFKPSEVNRTILNEVNPKKSPGYDGITGKMLQELPKKAIVLLTCIFNAVLRLEYFPYQWKVAQLVVVPKPGKEPHLASSYRPISLLPITSKVLEKLILKRLKPIIESTFLIPDHQFGFRRYHSTIEQVHRLTHEIRKALEEKKVCSAAFLDVQQAFDKVWHPGLLYKIKKNLPHSFYNLLKSYLSKRKFMVKFEDVDTNLIPIESGVPQGSVLGPVLYTLFTADIPNNQNTLLATFADDTAILSTDFDPRTASVHLQNSLNDLDRWFRKWRIKVNETKSSHISYTLRKDDAPTVLMNNVQLPEVQSVKYLGIHLDKRLTWKEHIWTKRLQLNLKRNKLMWLLGNKSKLSLENKLLLYKVMLKPIWTYGIQLWGSASTSNIEIIQRFQSATLRRIVEAPWYVSNEIIHRDLKIPTVKEEITRCSKKYMLKLENHDNHLAINLLDNSMTTERLKRSNILELYSRFVI